MKLKLLSAKVLNELPEYVIESSFMELDYSIWSYMSKKERKVIELSLNF